MFGLARRPSSRRGGSRGLDASRADAVAFSSSTGGNRAEPGLWREVDALVARPALHREHRSKGTGRFSITTPDGERKVIVGMGDELRAFDGKLDAYRGK